MELKLGDTIKSEQEWTSTDIVTNNSNCSASADLRILVSEELVCPTTVKESKMIFSPFKWIKVLKNKSKQQPSPRQSTKDKCKVSIWSKWFKISKKIGPFKAKKSEKPTIYEEKNNSVLLRKKSTERQQFTPLSDNLKVIQLAKLSKVNFFDKYHRQIYSV